jgi:hypothetical protein
VSCFLQPATMVPHALCDVSKFNLDALKRQFKCNRMLCNL